MPTIYLEPVSNILLDFLPPEIGELVDIEHFSQHVFYIPTSSKIVWDRDRFGLQYRVIITQKVKVGIPFLSGAYMTFGDITEAQEGGLVQLDVCLRFKPIGISIENFKLTFFFPSNILQSYEKVDGKWRKLKQQDGEKDFDGYELPFSTGLYADVEKRFNFYQPTIREDGENPRPFRIGKTKFILDIEDILIISGKMPFRNVEDIPKGIPQNFKGLWISKGNLINIGADIKFPTFEILNAAIGSGGGSGTVSLGSLEEAEKGLPKKYLVSEKEEIPELPEHLKALAVGNPSLNGSRVIFQYIGLTFQQSIPVASLITGHAFFPFIDKWMKFKASIGGPNGDFMLELGGALSEPLINLENDWIKITAESIAYRTDDGVHYADISGTILPKIPGFDWPEMKVEQLSVSSKGDIDIKDGFLTLPKSIAFDFKGFKVEVTEIGLGTEGEEDEEKRQWLGLSGGISLVEGLPLTASVQGLKFSWLKDGKGSKDVKISMEGIGVSMAIPGVLRLDGFISWAGPDPDSGLSGDVFRGSVLINMHALRTEVSGELLVGKLEDSNGRKFNAFYVAMTAELGYPLLLGSTGAAIFGFRGMFAQHLGPRKTEEKPWFDWYKEPATGATLVGEAAERTKYDLITIHKWNPQRGRRGFGAGLTIGTAFDSGFTFHIKAMFTLLTPGPVILFEGNANVLRQRDNNPGSGNFYLLALYDGRSDTFQLNIDMKYDIQNVLNLTADLEAFFDFNDSSNWHFYLGQKSPEAKRIHAKILSLFKVNAYFMIESRGVQFGAMAGFRLKKKLGPVNFQISAVISFDGAFFRKPIQTEGRIYMLGEISLKVFRIGFNLSLELLLEATAPRPYWIHGLARFKLGMPWPIPDIKFKVEFEWKKNSPFELPPFFLEGSMTHHLQPGSSWKFIAAPVWQMLDETTWQTLPGGGVLESENESVITFLLSAKVPVDTRPVMTFNRPILEFSRRLNDAGEKVPVGPEEISGKTLEYSIERMLLEAWDAELKSWMEIPILDYRRNMLLSFENYKIDFIYELQAPAFPWKILNDPDADAPQLELWHFSQFDHSNRYSRESIPDPCERVVNPKLYTVHWQYVKEGTSYPYEFEHQQVHFSLINWSYPVIDEDNGFVAVPEPFIVTRHNRTLHCLRTHDIQISFSKSLTYLVITVLLPNGNQKISAQVLSKGQQVDQIGFAASGGEYLKTERFDGGVKIIFSSNSRKVDSLLLAVGGIPDLEVSTHDERVPLYFDIMHISYVTYESFIAHQFSQQKTEDAQKSNHLYQDTILQPLTRYRLSMETLATTTGTDGPQKRNNYAFIFETLDGPGAISSREKELMTEQNRKLGEAVQEKRNDGGLSQEEQEQLPVQLASGYPEFYRFETYLHRTVPEDGARQFYYQYDIGLEFLEPYVQDLYAGPLRIRLRDRNGNTLGGEKGRWTLGSLPLFKPGIMAYLAAKESQECGAQSYDWQYPPYLYREAPTELKPSRLYTAEVVTWVPDQTDAVLLYSFQFTCSRYPSFTSHFNSGMREKNNGDIVQVNHTLPFAYGSPPISFALQDWIDDYRLIWSEWQVSRMEVSAKLESASLLELADQIEAIQKKYSSLHDFCSTTFDRLYRQMEVHFSAIGQINRSLPKQLEFVHMAIPDTKHFIVLLESPEPIDWARVSLSIAGFEDTIEIVWNEDQTRAFLFFGANFPEAGIWNLEFTFNGSAAPELGQISKKRMSISDDAIEPVEETVNIRLWIGALQVKLPDEFVGNPIIIEKPDGIIDLLVKDREGKLWHRWKNEMYWGAWGLLPGDLNPDADLQVADQGINLDIITKNTKNNIIHGHWDGQRWSSWNSLDAEWSQSFNLVSWPSGQVEVLAVDEGGRINTRRLNDEKWSGWQILKESIQVTESTSLQVINPRNTKAGPKLLFVGRDVEESSDNTLQLLKWDDSESTWEFPPTKLGPKSIPNDMPTVTGQPEAVIQNEPHKSAKYFVRGTDNSLWFTSYDERKPENERWTDWQQLGDNLPTGASIQALQLDTERSIVATRNKSNQLIYRRFEAGVWQDWVKTNVTFTQGLQMIRSGYHQLSFTGLGLNNQIQEYQLDLPESIRYGRPTAVYPRGGLGYVFTVDEIGDVYYQLSLDRELGAPEQIGQGAVPNSRVAAVVDEQQIEIFIVANNASIRHRKFNGKNWLAWQDLGGWATSTPTALLWRKDHLDLYIRDSAGRLTYRRRSHGSWQEWAPLHEKGEAFMQAHSDIVALSRTNVQESIQLFYANESYAGQEVKEFYYLTWNRSEEQAFSWIGPRRISSSIAQDPFAHFVGSPGVARWQDPDAPQAEVIHWVGKTSDGSVWYTNYDSRRNGSAKWNDNWQKIGDGIHTDGTPTLFVLPNEQVYVFFRNLKNELLYSKGLRGSWSEWQKIASGLFADIEVVQKENSALTVFSKTANGTVARYSLKTVIPTQPRLFWTDSLNNEIVQTTLDGTHRKPIAESPLASPGGVAIDPDNDKMYFINGLKIQRSDLNGNWVETVIDTGAGRPYGIFFDRQSRKLYWFDMNEQKIQRANWDGSQLEDIVTNVISDRPGNLFVSAPLGKIYWTDRRTSTIYEANLDGRDVKIIISSDLQNPAGIAVNLESRKLYWTDYGTRKIQRANLDGSEVETLLSGVSNTFGLVLDLSSDKMYWSESSNLKRANLNGSDIESIAGGLGEGRQISFHARRSEIYWASSGFDQIGRVKVDGTDKEILLKAKIVNPHGIAFDSNSQQVYWVERQGRRIRRANVDGTGMRDLVTENLTNPADLALDLSASQIYWVDRSKNLIGRSGLDGQKIETVLKEGVNNPTSMALDLQNRTIFWVNRGTDNKTEIKKVNMDGSNPESILTIGGGGSGIALDVANNHFYFGRLSTIQRARLDGSSLEVIISITGIRIQDLIIDSDAKKIYWTDSEKRKIQRANLDGSNIEDVVYQGMGAPYGLTLGSINTKEKDSL